MSKASCSVDSNINLLCYLQILQDILLLFIAEKLPGSAVFQQDNASTHTSNLAKVWFKNNNINLLAWSPKLSNLNPIEILWDLLTCSVYDNGNQQFSSKEKVKIGTFNKLECTKWLYFENINYK